MPETIQQPENGLSNDCRRKQNQKWEQSVTDNKNKGQHFGPSPK